MNVLKSIGQILSALIYTPLYTGVMYMAMVIPTIWIVTLSFWKMIAAIVVLGGIIEGLVMLVQTIGLMPYAWIVKENKVAFWISIALCVVFPILNVISLWRMLLTHGGLGIFTAIILTLIFLQFVYGSVLSLCGLGLKEND